jgi:beta-mannosidase
MNVIRNWGGGIYQHDAYYNIAGKNFIKVVDDNNLFILIISLTLMVIILILIFQDELGLMIWEEFMFACAMYPVDQAFLNNVGEEVHYQVENDFLC